MKILVTGATGFIGQHLCRSLMEQGFFPVGLVRESSNSFPLEEDGIPFQIISSQEDFFQNLFSNGDFQGVIHLATKFVFSHTGKDIAPLIDSNITLGAQLMEGAVRAGVKWFLNAGTSWQHFEGRDFCPTNLYSATKEAFEKIAHFYVETSPIHFATLKLSDTYGPGDTRKKIFSLWREIGISGKSLDMSPGEQIIDICYIDDVVEAFLQVMEILSTAKEQIKMKSYFITAKKKYSLKELALVFQKVSGYKLNIHWGKLPYRNREVMNPACYGEPVPGWSARVPLKKGIPKIL